MKDSIQSGKKAEEVNEVSNVFIAAVAETKVRVAYYLSTTTNAWLRKAWQNEYDKQQPSCKKEAEDVLSGQRSQVPNRLC